MERGTTVLKDPLVWPPIERTKEFAAANLQAESYLQRERDVTYQAYSITSCLPLARLKSMPESDETSVKSAKSEPEQPKKKRRKRGSKRAKRAGTRAHVTYPKHTVSKCVRIPQGVLEQNAGRECTYREAAGFTGLGYTGALGVEIPSGHLSRVLVSTTFSPRPRRSPQGHRIHQHQVQPWVEPDNVGVLAG